MPYATSKVLLKAAALLDHLAAEGPASPARLAELLDEPRASVYRLLASLESVSLVERLNGGSEYRLGTGILRLADAIVHQFDARTVARPVLERLGAETELTVFLCIRRGYEAVCIDLIPGRWVQSMAMRLGSSLPLHAGTAPASLLAFESEDFVDGYLAAGPLTAFTDSTPTRPSDVRRKLAAIRADGFAIGDGDIVPGLAAIGAPIFDHRGRVTASVSISGARPAVLGERRDELRDGLVEAAEAISGDLGHRPAARRPQPSGRRRS